MQELTETPALKPQMLLTIICPVHNEATVILLFYARIRPVIDTLLTTYNVNLVFSNNCSSDNTLQVIENIRKKAKDIFVISLSANVGYQRSLECCLRHCKGDLLVFIDVDCEDPPEMIIEFLKVHHQGYDIVYGERTDREESAVIKLLRKIFYRLLRIMADDNVIIDMAEFCLLTNEVRNAIIQDASSYPFIRASIARVGFRYRGIAYKRQKRIAGSTHYNFSRLTKFALAGILSSSTLLLRMPIYILPLWLLLMFILPVLYILSDNKWFLCALFFIFASYIGISISFVALYVARIVKNTLGRPNYIINQKESVLQPGEIT